MIRLGTNRLVIIGRKVVYKLPLGLRGLRANKVEFKNAINNPLIAQTEKHWWGLRQERLYDIIIYKLDIDRDDICLEHRHLFDVKLHNRLQVGRSKNGLWKIFDYEDVKYQERSN